MKKRALVVTDNTYLYESFKRIAESLARDYCDFDYRFSPKNTQFTPTAEFHALDVKTEVESILNLYNLVISLHCKQLVPAELHTRIRCINIHPGLNPHNRGWFPQVFSIINKKPLGATIHEIDSEIDHGPIIDQAVVPIHSWDTSLTAYNRVMEAELHLIERRLIDIIDGDYKTTQVTEEGNLNLKKDFDQLCRLDLKEEATVGAVIDRLRATTHGDYRNSYFIDESGQKVFVMLQIEKAN